jgi:hypothetical protein
VRKPMQTPSIQTKDGKVYLYTTRHDDQQARPILEWTELDEDKVERLFVELSTARCVVSGLMDIGKRGRDEN